MPLSLALILAIVCAGPERAVKGASDAQLLKAANAHRITDIEQEIAELESALKGGDDSAKADKKKLSAQIKSLKVELKRRKTSGKVEPPVISTPYREGQVGILQHLGGARVAQIMGPDEMLVNLTFDIPTPPNVPPGIKPGDEKFLTPRYVTVRSLVMLRGMPTGGLADDLLLELPRVLEVGDNYTYQTAAGTSNTVRILSPFTIRDTPAGGYPTIAGLWRESPTIALTITQDGNEFKALCKYVHDRDGEIHWKMTGTVTKDGQIKGKLVHTKGPKTYGGQTRTGVVSSDGATITGHATFDGGGGHDFEWTLEATSKP